MIQTQYWIMKIWGLLEQDLERTYTCRFYNACSARDRESHLTCSRQNSKADANGDLHGVPLLIVARCCVINNGMLSKRVRLDSEAHTHIQTTPGGAMQRCDSSLGHAARKEPPWLALP